MENTTGSSNESENELDPRDFIDIDEHLGSELRAQAELDLDKENRLQVD